MYLWCKMCEHAHHIDLWTMRFNPGLCPSPGCHAQQYRYALSWKVVAAANDYPEIPDPDETYPYELTLF